MLASELAHTAQNVRSLGPWWGAALLAVAVLWAVAARDVEPWGHDLTPVAGMTRR
jgi:hypothetical protein